jgi:hypothetical protein
MGVLPNKYRLKIYDYFCSMASLPHMLDSYIHIRYKLLS